MNVGGFNPTITLYFDALTLVMVLVITGVGFLIHLYSTEFMEGEEGTSRFFAYMNLFVGMMLTLVLGGNLLLLISRLGRGRLVQLPADRLLVQGPGQRARRAQGVYRHACRRHRLRHRVVPALPGTRHARHPAADAARGGTVGPPVRAWPSWPRRCCWAARWANPLSFRCKSGCPTPWPARPRSAR